MTEAKKARMGFAEFIQSIKGLNGYYLNPAECVWLPNEVQALIDENEKLVEKLNKFITKSNGLSFYCRDEYQKTRLQMTDSVDLVERLESLYAFQCEVEAYLKEQG